MDADIMSGLGPGRSISYADSEALGGTPGRTVSYTVETNTPPIVNSPIAQFGYQTMDVADSKRNSYKRDGTDTGFSLQLITEESEGDSIIHNDPSSNRLIDEIILAEKEHNSMKRGDRNTNFKRQMRRQGTSV